jgi:hypothetical protein
MLGFLCYLGLKAMSPVLLSPLVPAIWSVLRWERLHQVHLVKILDLVNWQTILLEVGEEVIYQILLLVLMLVLFLIMEFIIRKNFRKIFLMVLARTIRVERMVPLLLITLLLGQAKEGPPLRLSQCPVLADLSILVRLLATDVVVDSPLLRECGIVVALQEVETSLATVLQLAIGVSTSQMLPPCGTVILGHMGGITLHRHHQLLSLLENADHPVHILLLRLVLLRDVIGGAIKVLTCQEIVATGPPLKKKPTLSRELGKADPRLRLLLQKEIVTTILLEVQIG